MKNHKTIKAILFSVVLTLGVFTSVRIVKGYYKQLRVEFFKDTKGLTHDFMNSFIY